MSDDYRARLIAARERLGLSLKEMAQRLLTPRQTYEQWEAGKRRTPGVAVAAAELLSPPRVWTKAAREQRTASILAELAQGKTPEECSEKWGLSVITIRDLDRRARRHRERETA